MSLHPFNLIFTVDGDNGFSKNGDIPWDNDESASFARTLTVGKTGDRNAVIVGRVTFENLIRHPFNGGRQTYVISRSWRQEDHNNVRVFGSFRAALEAATAAKLTNVYVYGGATLLEEVTSKWLYLCERVYATKLKNKYQCDTTFPWTVLEKMDPFKDPVKTNLHVRYEYVSTYAHRETQILDLANELLSDPRNEGLSERHQLGVSLEFDLSRTFPALTTNYVDLAKVSRLFVFSVSGGSDARNLARAGVDTYSAITSSAAQEANGHQYLEGDMGPWWGWIMRHYGATYAGCDAAPDPDEEIDQLTQALESLRKGANSAVVYLNSPSYSKTVIDNRYQTVTWYFSKDRRTLDTVFNLASSEIVDTLGTDVALAGLFGTVMATFLQVKPGALMVTVGDLWCAKIEPLKKMASRTPLPFPRLQIRDPTRFLGLTNVSNDSFIFTGYDHHTIIVNQPTRQPDQLVIRRRRSKK